MKTSAIFYGVICALLFMTHTASAENGKAPPAPGILFEAENCQHLDAKSWHVVRFKHTDPFTIFPSGGGVLEATSSAAHPASGIVAKNAESGEYRVWARFRTPDRMDISVAPFTIVLKQNGKKLSSKTFEVPSSGLSADIRPDNDAFTWLPFGIVKLENGTLSVEFTQEYSEELDSIPASIDCIYLSANIADSNPPSNKDVPRQLYVRFVVGADGAPMTLSIGGRTWDWKNRLTIPPFGKHEDKPGKKATVKSVTPGNASDWLNISEASDFTKEWYLVDIRAQLPVKKNAHLHTDYRLQFSTCPDESGIFIDHHVSGNNPRVSGWMGIADRIFRADYIEAETTAQKIEAMPPVKGRRPQKFPVATAICVEGLSDSVVDREMRNVAALGFNSFGLGTSIPFFIKNAGKYGFTFLDGQQFRGELIAKTRDENGLESVDQIASAEKAAEFAKLLRDNNVNIPFCSLADEPSMNFAALTSNPALLADFPKFLADNGVYPTELGVSTLTDARPARYAEAKTPALHYWSMRYYIHAFGKRFKDSTTAAATQNLRTGANFACQAVGNILWDGADWFQFFRDGTLSYGWTEDWFNMCNTYQFAGFQMAVMRAACIPAGTPYGTYCVIGNRTPWDVGAKAFTQLARKLDSFKVFNYGPSYGNSDNMDLREPELLREVRDVIHAIGAVEDIYIASQPLPGDVAMLYSTTSDIWNSKKQDWFPSSLPGLERSTLYLLLGQCGVRTDIIYEGDLKHELEDRRVLFAVDSHIHTDNIPPLANWVKKGGTLYLGANALAFDQYNRPTEIESLLGIKRGAFELESIPGILSGSSPKSIETVPVTDNEAVPVMYGMQSLDGEPLALFANGKKALTISTVGNGVVVQCGFFPGLSHFKRAKHNKALNFQSLSEYPENTRKFIRNMLKTMKIEPAVYTDHPLIEAQLLRTQDKDLLVLSNWSGERQQVTITLRTGISYTSVRAIRSNDAKLVSINGVSTLKLTIETGDFVELH